MHTRRGILAKIGAGLSALMSASVPGCMMEPASAASGVPVFTPHSVWSDVLAKHANMVVGTAEKGIWHRTWVELVENCRKAGWEVDFFYGTVTGKSTDGVTIIDALHWRFADEDYRGVIDPKRGIEYPSANGRIVYKTEQGPITIERVLRDADGNVVA